MSIRSALTLAAICLTLTACGSKESSDQNISPAADTKMPTPSVPQEIGIWGSIGGQPVKLDKGRTWHVDAVMNTENPMSPDQFPVIDLGTSVTLNKVPIDPSEVYWAYNLMLQERGRQGYMGFWSTYQTSSQPVPAVVTEVQPGVYSIKVEGMQPGLHALIFGSARFGDAAVVNVR